LSQGNQTIKIIFEYQMFQNLGLPYRSDSREASDSCYYNTLYRRDQTGWCGEWIHSL